MRKLFEFIRSIYVVVLFVALEVAAISYYAHSTHYTQARLLARSNQVAGGVHGFFAGIRRYFSLGHENRLLLGRVAQLEEWLAQYEDFSTVINEYSQRCVTLGKTVKLVQNNTETTAFAKAIAPDGCLICENENGEFTVNSGLVRVRGVGGEYV